ncbi:MAG: hypothetical protein H0W09_08000, partial [Solirubrobacterales bacterium]|nr:hypothetical protein [Solirubrobacterales bacterium]
MLRPLLQIAEQDEAFSHLASEVRAPSAAVEARISPSLRPFLLATLLDSADALAGRAALIVAPDDVGARDLARGLEAYLHPRRVRLYPSRGTGYASQIAPPPHLVGLRIGALDALTAFSGEGEAP